MEEENEAEEEEAGEGGRKRRRRDEMEKGKRKVRNVIIFGALLNSLSLCLLLPLPSSLFSSPSSKSTEERKAKTLEANTEEKKKKWTKGWRAFEEERKNR